MTTDNDVEIKPVRLLGTTWHKRGVRYWARRTTLLFFWSALLALTVGIIATLFSSAATETSGGGRIVLLLVMSLAVAGSFCWGFSLMRRSDEEKKLGVPMIIRAGTTAEQRQRAGSAGYRAGLFGGPLIIIAQFVVVGVLAAIVVGLLQKYISIEEFEAATGRKAPPRVKRPSVWSQMRHRG